MRLDLDRKDLHRCLNHLDQLQLLDLHRCLNHRDHHQLLNHLLLLNHLDHQAQTHPQRTPLLKAKWTAAQKEANGNEKDMMVN